MTWLLAKVGLSAIPGRSFIPLIAVCVAILAVIAGTMYAIHHYTAKGYDQAALECAAGRTADRLRIKGLEADAADDLRDNAVTQAVRRQQLVSGAAIQRQEVIDDAKANPEQPGCVLSDRGLRLWNADPGADAGSVQIRGGDAGTDQGRGSEPAASGLGRSLLAPSQSAGFKAGASGFVDRRPGAGQGSGDLQGAADKGSGTAGKQQAR